MISTILLTWPSLVLETKPRQQQQNEYQKGQMSALDLIPVEVYCSTVHPVYWEGSPIHYVWKV
jgi:hypothetical protein